jgi:hypothetical protein
VVSVSSASDRYPEQVSQQMHAQNELDAQASASIG